VLAYLDSAATFILDTDASNEGIGAVLSQGIDGEERPVAFFSRTLTRPQRNYCVTRRELLAVVKSIKQFHTYLYGQQFVVRTDHSALQWLLNFRHPEGQVAKWLEVLQSYSFTIQHRPGPKHSNADALSRRPCLTTDCKYCSQLELKDTQGAEPSSQPTVQAVNLSAGIIADMGIATSPEALRQAQLADENLKPVLEWLELDTTRPPWEVVAPFSGHTKAYWAQSDSLKLENGVLYRKWETTAGDTTLLQLVVPKELQEHVLKQLHGTRTARHFGVSKTLGHVKERFYWVDCRRDVQDWHLCSSMW
ncbi:MAG: hypothetical protein MPL62_14355, partial [Alphaproteobacteria bacterium]|nr:hypothetical protein [Alphaproteobacteria bacterium]